jgi:hypothetical protein
MANETPTDSQPTPAQAAASAVTDDPQTAELLARHANKEKLTPAEYGKLGGWKRWLGLSKVSPDAKPAGAGSQSGNPAALAAMAPGEAPADSLEPVEIDDGLCKRTTAAVLGRADAWAVGWIEREAKAAGAEGNTLDNFRRAAGLPVADQKLLVEISPDVFRELGMNPRQFAVWTALGVIGFHGFNLYQCVSDLREMRKNKPADTARPSAPEKSLTPGKTSAPAKPGDKDKAPAPALEQSQPIVKMSL